MSKIHPSVVVQTINTNTLSANTETSQQYVQSQPFAAVWYQTGPFPTNGSTMSTNTSNNINTGAPFTLQPFSKFGNTTASSVYNTSNGIITIPTTGLWNFGFSARTSVGVGNNSNAAQLAINSMSGTYGTRAVATTEFAIYNSSINITLPCVAGDTFCLSCWCGGVAYTLAASPQSQWSLVLVCAG